MNIKIKKYLTFSSLYWLLSLALLLFFHSQNNFDSDEGVILEGAWNMINHKELYTDFFEFVPPGSFYLIFLTWKIFEPSYFAAKLVSLFIFWMTGIGIFKISNLFKKSIYNYISPLVFFCSSFYWPIINHNTHNLFFLVFASYLFIVALTNNKKIYFIFSGLTSSLAILFLQQKGFVLIATLFSYLILLAVFENNKIRLKNSALYLSSAILPISIIFIKWPAKIIYENIVSFPLENYIEFNKIPYSLLIFFIIITAITAIVLRKFKSKRIYFLLYLQLALLATTFARPDQYHIYLILFPLYSLIPLIIKKAISHKSIIKYLYFSIITIVLILIILPSFLFLFFQRPSLKNSPAHEIINIIKENCPRQNDLFAGPFIPGIYFESEKVNFTPYYLLMTGLQNNEIFEEVKNLIILNEANCIVMNYQIGEKFKYSKDNPVDKYIENNYTLNKEISNTFIFIKNK